MITEIYSNSRITDKVGFGRNISQRKENGCLSRLKPYESGYGRLGCAIAYRHWRLASRVALADALARIRDRFIIIGASWDNG
jgi:hypothetical protein